MSKIKIYLPNEIDLNLDLIKHKNAFILKDGNFVLAKGYKDCNPSHQLESSALKIARELYDYSFIEKYRRENPNEFYYLRTMLVHYYGLVLFCRKEVIKSVKDRNKFLDYSIIPNPIYHGLEPTMEQLETLKELFKINDDGTLLQNSEKTYQKVINYEDRNYLWHLK